ncbi:MAG: fatty acid hydroxylase [Alphaproteobacteria bacterium]|nr:MAG: fatty acid hydroxylase [Alphaproteobacteria bacterium]
MQIEALLRALWTAYAGLFWPALIFAGAALAFRGVEALHTARRASGEVRTNLLLFTFDIIAVTPLLVLMMASVGAWLQTQGLRLFSAAQWEALPAALVVFIALFIGDFVAYWRHRLEHVGLIWPWHAIHHSDERMTWTTGLRFHPLNRLTTTLIDMSALALLGLPIWAVVVNGMVRHYYGMFIHMDLPWTYGPLGRVFVSPAMHRWHHVRDARGAGVNFATLFSVFDQAFGTYHVQGPCAAPLGVRDEIGKGAFAQLVWPLRVLMRNLRFRARVGTV